METLNIIGVVINLFFLGYLTWFKSYFSEKGKQLALKEDIEEITTKVETIKSDIDLLNKTRHQVVLNELELIMNFHNEFVIFYNLLNSKFPSEVNTDNYNNLAPILDEISDQRIKWLVSGDKLELYNANKKVLDLKNEAVTNSHEIQKIIINYFYKYSLTFIDDKEIEFEKNHVKQVELYRESHQKRKEIFDEYHNESSDHFAKLIELKIELTAILREIIEQKNNN